MIPNGRSAGRRIGPRRGVPAAIAALLGWLGVACSGSAAEVASTSGNVEALNAARSWTYQLQKLDVGTASREAGDLLVTDYSLDGSHAKALTADTVRTLQTTKDGGRRLVVAYLSIGEAESYRYYWSNRWVVPPAGRDAEAMPKPVYALQEPPAGGEEGCVSGVATGQAREPSQPMVAVDHASAPAWLGDENERWRGNFLVKFWHPEWQAIMFGSPESYLDRIIAAGFDGVYLDRADAHEQWRGRHATAEQDMARFIARLSAYAKTRDPDFLVILQNAEELTALREVRDAVDGVAKEDLLHGIDNSERANCDHEVEHSLGYLRNVQASGLATFGVEYVTDASKAEAAREKLAELGIVGTIAVRALDAPSR